MLSRQDVYLEVTEQELFVTERLDDYWVGRAVCGCQQLSGRGGGVGWSIAGV